MHCLTASDVIPMPIQARIILIVSVIVVTLLAGQNRITERREGEKGRRGRDW
jgi:hypothetical protein